MSADVTQLLEAIDSGEQEPLKPSTRVSTLQGEERTNVARHRHVDPSRLGNELRGDLDWIVMKCLEKDRTRRYETANALSLELSRHLASEPVRARPPARPTGFRNLFAGTGLRSPRLCAWCSPSS
jgi:non-specific serine/threonine protein kinase/serine/threonine-protein kinase